MKEVKTGIQNENYIEITDGLNAGDLIVSAPYTAISRHLKDKTRIKVVDKKTLFEDKK
jgi:HlyD family secretion protein